MRAYVLDANALLSYLEDRPGANRLAELLKQALKSGRPLLMSVVNWGEVFYNVWRARGEESARRVATSVSRLPIEFVPADLSGAQLAAELKAQHGIPYADCFAAALAIAQKGTVVTADADFRKLGRKVPILWLSRS